MADSSRTRLRRYTISIREFSRARISNTFRAFEFKTTSDGGMLKLPTPLLSRMSDLGTKISKKIPAANRTAEKTGRNPRHFHFVAESGFHGEYCCPAVDGDWEMPTRFGSTTPSWLRRLSPGINHASSAQIQNNGLISEFDFPASSQCIAGKPLVMVFSGSFQNARLRRAAPGANRRSTSER